MQVSGRIKRQGLPHVRRLLALLSVGTSVAALYIGEFRCGLGGGNEQGSAGRLVCRARHSSANKL